MSQRLLSISSDWSTCKLYCRMRANLHVGRDQGYHQIPLAKADQDKVSFVISFGTFCYTVMLFGLKNARATYQGLMDKASKKQLERNIEIYIDDILVKSVKFKDLVATLEVTFTTLCRHCLKLNPGKCIFSVRSERILGYLITERGIEVNPEKVRSLQYDISKKISWKFKGWLEESPHYPVSSPGQQIGSSPFSRFSERWLGSPEIISARKPLPSWRDACQSCPHSKSKYWGEHLWIYLATFEEVVSLCC